MKWLRLTALLDMNEQSRRVRQQHAFVAARARMAEHSIPELIERLASPDLRTRFLAEMCLRDATGI